MDAISFLESCICYYYFKIGVDTVSPKYVKFNMFTINLFQFMGIITCHQLYCSLIICLIKICRNTINLIEIQDMINLIEIQDIINLIEIQDML